MRPTRLGSTDEAYLLLESTVGVVAPMQMVIVVDDPGEDVATEIVDRLVGGPLDRAVRRPVVPGARPVWIRPSGTAVSVVDTDVTDDVDVWATRHMATAPLDVVGRRGWQRATVATASGDRAISVVASHVLADGRRFVETIADAVAALDGPVVVAPAPTSSESRRSVRVAHDIADAAVAVVDAGRAIRRLVAARRETTDTTVISDTDNPAPTVPRRPDDGVMDDGPIQRVVTLDRRRWQAVASAHGGTPTTLLVAMGAGLARRGGITAARRGPDAPVRVSLAVDRREAGDTTTANTAGGVALRLAGPVDPQVGLTGVRTAIRAALAEPPSDDAVARIARLLPPRVLARVVGSIPGPDVSVSHLGAAPEGLMTWRGRRARRVFVRAAARTAAPDLARTVLPGVALWTVEHDDAVTLTVCAADPAARADIDRVLDAELRRWDLS